MTIRRILNRVKGIVSSELLKVENEADESQLMYINDLIDYVILGDLEFDELMYEQLYEELELAGYYQGNKNLLKTLPDILSIGKSLGFCSYVRS